MYVPAHFTETDPAEIAAIMANAPLACLVAMGSAGLEAHHLPLISAPNGQLIGHIARANDLHRTLADGAEVLVILRGAEGYISPNAYPSKAAHHRHVPTWNYQAVHISGQISFQHDQAAVRAAVALLTRVHERRANPETPWKMADAPADYMQQMLENIVAFRITPARVLAKSKLSQNREPADAAGAIADVAGRSGGAALAAAMAAKLAAR